MDVYFFYGTVFLLEEDWSLVDAISVTLRSETLRKQGGPLFVLIRWLLTLPSANSPTLPRDFVPAAHLTPDLETGDG